MNIPNYLSTPPINPETGEWTPEWSNLMQQTFSQLQSSVGQEGFVTPALPTTEIDKLTDASKSTGALVYDSTTNELKANINGAWKVVTVT